MCLRTTGQDMESESESESKWDPESSTDSHSLSENEREKKGKRRGERKMRKHTCKQKGPILLMYTQQEPSQRPN